MLMFKGFHVEHNMALTDCCGSNCSGLRNATIVNI